MKPYNLNRHLKRAHLATENERTYYCGLCPSVFSKKKTLFEHRREKHCPKDTGFHLIKSAHQQARQQAEFFVPKQLAKSVSESHMYIRSFLLDYLEALCAETPLFKVILALNVHMVQFDYFTQTIADEDVFSFSTHEIHITRASFYFTAEQKVDAALQKIEKNIDEFLERKSGWNIEEILAFHVTYAETAGFNGQSCKLPHIARFKSRGYGKGAILELPHMESESEIAAEKNCFYYAVAAGLLPPGLRQDRSECRKVIRTMTRLENLDGGVEPEDIAEFEKLNEELSVAVNVIYVDEDGKPQPCYASKNFSAETSVCLALFHHLDNDGTEVTAHFALVERPEAFMAKRFSPGRGDDYYRTVPQFPCFNCFNTFETRSWYEKHRTYCHKKGSQMVS